MPAPGCFDCECSPSVRSIAGVRIVNTVNPWDVEKLYIYPGCLQLLEILEILEIYWNFKPLLEILEIYWNFVLSTGNS